MPDVTVSNTPVSVTLSEGEFVEVPSGEVWRVTIAFGSGDADRGNVVVEINGRSVGGASVSDEGTTVSGLHGSTISTVLTGGDSVFVKAVGNGINDAGAHIGGFIVA